MPAERLNDDLTAAASKSLSALTAHAKRLKGARRSLTVDGLLAGVGRTGARP